MLDMGSLPRRVGRDAIDLPINGASENVMLAPKLKVTLRVDW